MHNKIMIQNLKGLWDIFEDLNEKEILVVSDYA